MPQHTYYSAVASLKATLRKNCGTTSRKKFQPGESEAEFMEQMSQRCKRWNESIISTHIITRNLLPIWLKINF